MAHPTLNNVVRYFISNRGTLRPFIDARRRARRKSTTINLALAVVRHLLNLAAWVWLDEHNLTWLAAPPKIKVLKVEDALTPYPLGVTTAFGPNGVVQGLTGSRDRQLCGLRSEWEVVVPEVDVSIFGLRAAAVSFEERQDLLGHRSTLVMLKQRAPTAIAASA